jgi:3-phenylpropionate/trans-cinnamate dioxygenase alpha subunit
MSEIIRRLSALDIDNGVLDPFIYADEDVYQLELERVFARSWLFLAHECQVPQPGDFFSSYMAEDPIVVLRQRDGSIAAFLNQCRHRGMRLCQSDFGHTQALRCPYHGWAYNIEGQLVGVPHEKDGYRNELDKSKWPLKRVPRVECYKGLVFGNWDADAPALTDYLGDAAWYLDGYLDRVAGGNLLIGGTQKWVVGCNWKLAAEQFSSDMYHGMTTHGSAMAAMSPPGFDFRSQGVFGSQKAVQYADRNGHGGGFFVHDEAPQTQVWVQPAARDWQYASLPEAETRLGRTRAWRLAGHNNIFPNFSYNLATQTARVWHPRGPGQLEVWAWVLVDAAAPDAAKEAFKTGNLRSFGPAGMLEQDDVENWIEVQKILRGAMARKTEFCVGMGRGHERHDADGYKGTTNYVMAETAARAFYRHWRDLMTSDGWHDIAARRAVEPDDRARRAEEPVHG